MKAFAFAAAVGVFLAVQRGALPGLGPALLLLTLAGVLVWAFGRRAGGRDSQAHFHGGHDDKVRLHEGAHLSAAKKIGAPVARTRLGNSPMVVLADPEALSSRDYMAFMLAGEAATGGAGTAHDRANVRAEQKRMRERGASSSEIRRDTSAARSDARRYARGAAHWAKRL